MSDDQKELMKVLPGLREDMPEPFWRLAEIFADQVFELCTDGESPSDYFIPYMMNDAVECYLRIEQCRMTGSFREEETGFIQGELLTESEGYGLIVRQAEGNVFTLWFADLRWEMHLFQYHTIGHFWQKGQEQWRQLVYMAGTLHDKYDYLGSAACSEKEKALYRLIEFGPFRKWSPIRDDLEERYPPTYEGIDCMLQLAREAGDRNYGRMLRIYRRFPFRRLETWLCQRLKSHTREALYQLIYDRMCQASEEYPPRRYKKKEQKAIEKQRAEADAWLREQGFQGHYPEYQKGNNRIQVTEEQPFTILESEDYIFRIHFMISETKKGPLGRNSGFFDGNGRKGIVKEFKKSIDN